MVSCDAANKATMLTMGSLELLLRASVFVVLYLSEMSGTTLPREALGVSLSGMDTNWRPLENNMRLMWALEG